MRLDRFISNQTELSRAESREVLKQKRITVNGQTVKDFGFNINPENDKVALDGNPISYSEFVYILMNKPKGVLTATEDKLQDTVLDLLPSEFKSRHPVPVGRLDKDTTGILLLTDDGNYAHRVISPKSLVEKEYIVSLDGSLPQNAKSEFEQGITLADGTKCMPAKLEIIEPNIASVTIKEGKYHQIKRMFGVLGLGVNELSRVRIGNLFLPENLQSGDFVLLNQDEKDSVFANNS